jgi:ketosteroid isomerase-like protein
MAHDSHEEPQDSDRPARRRRLAAAAGVLALLALLVVALTTDLFGGGDDKEDAEQVVRDFVTATNKRDAEKLCDELLTEEFIEQATGATGDQARDSCKQQLKATQALNIQLRSIRRTEVDGDQATVVALIAVQSQEQRRTFRLRKEDGDWRLAGGAGSGG